MKTKTKGLSYVGTEDGVDRYTYFTENRRILDVLVDTNFAVDPSDLGEGIEVPPGTTLHRIMIAKVDAPLGTAQVTKGIATRAPHIETNAQGQEGLHTHVASASIFSYLYPRMVTMLARLFVPAAS